MRSDKKFQLITLVKIWASDKLLKKHVQIETSLFNKVLLGVSCLTLWRNWRDVEPGMPLEQYVSQKIELTESSLNLKSTLRIFPKNRICNMVSPLYFPRIAHTKLLCKLIGSK